MRLSHRLEPILLYGCLATLLAVALRLSLVRFFNVDEFEAIHSGWKVLQGGRPYFDFFQHHHPYLYYVLARVIDVFGEGAASMHAARMLHFAAKLAILAVTGVIARDVFDRKTVPFALVMLASTVIFVDKAIEVRPDVLQTLFGLLAVMLFVRHSESGLRRHIALAGVCLGISFLFLQKALFLVALLVLLGALRVVTRRMSLSHLAVGGAAFVLTLLPEYAWMAASASLATYWDLNWTINVPTEHGFGPTYGMIESYRENSVLWIAYVLGVPFALADRRRRELALLSLGLLASLFIVKRPWPQYYLMPVTLMAPIAADAVRTAFLRRPPLGAAVAVLGALPCLYHFTVREVYTNERQLRAVEHVVALADPNERVHDGHNRVNLFREDLDWFWFSVRPNGMLDRYRALIGDYDYDAEELVLRHRPRVIVETTVDVEDPRIAGQYVPSDEFKNLYVRKDTRLRDPARGRP